MFKFFSLLTVAAAIIASPAIAQPEKTYEFKNAYWYDGDGFRKKRSVYGEWGRLRFSRPQKVDETIDLKGGYVIPPLCEAHNHNIGGNYQTQETIDAYLGAGVFYVMVFSNLPLETGRERHLFNRPDSVDAAFANGGLTGPGGHPIKLRERLLDYGAYDGFTKETLADHAYFVFSEAQDIEEKWPLILSYQPDFIKIFLLHAEDYAARRDDPDFFGHKGLDPKLIPDLVKRAHRHGLRVAAHVETGYDFHVAIAAGVDIIAHLPGYSSPQRIEPADAERAADNGAVVITTASLAEKRKKKSQTLYEEIRKAQIANLRLLREAGVKIALGSDNYESNSTAEAEYLRNMNVFSDHALLDMWTRQCSQTIFPDRQVGELRDNFEASFIVLGADPLKNWDALSDIKLRVKDGRPITPTE